MKTIKEYIKEVTQAIRYPKVEKLSDEQKEYVVWMLTKALKKQRKDVLGLIDERIKKIKQAQKECCDKWYCESCNVKLCIINDFEELKKRISGENTKEEITQDQRRGCGRF